MIGINSTSKNHLEDEYFRKASITQKIIEKNTGKSLTDFLEDKNWSIEIDLVIDLINNDIDEQQATYLEEVLGSLDHLKDNRSSQEYALDLLAGWMIEDLLIELLKQEFEIKRDSADKRREFLQNPEASSDLSISLKDQDVPLEITHDNSGFWQREEEWSTLRDKKFENLKKENALVLGLDINNEDFFLQWVEELDKIGKSYNSKINKNVSKVNLGPVKFYDIKKLENVLGAKIHNED